jgi:hypothetical protein
MDMIESTEFVIWFEERYPEVARKYKKEFFHEYYRQEPKR